MIVCVCRGVSDRAVRAAIDGGAAGVQDVTQATGAGASCGCCRGAIADMLATSQGCASPPCAGCPRRADEGRREAA